MVGRRNTYVRLIVVQYKKNNIMSKTTKDCGANKVLNPVSNRCVLRNGTIGRKIMNDHRSVPEVYPQPHVRQNVSGTEMPSVLYTHLEGSSNPDTSSRLAENDLQTWVTQGWLNVAYVPSQKSMDVLEKRKQAHEAIKHAHSVKVYMIFEGMSITNDMFAFLRRDIYKKRGFRGTQRDVPQQFQKYFW